MSKTMGEWDRGGRTGKNSFPPLYASIREQIKNNPGCVCLIQVGSFYELYFEQATEYGPKLGIKVATKQTADFNIPMSGFPVYQLQKFVKILVHDHQTNVAIVDQIFDAASNKIHRKISRIVSPGTLVEESFINYSDNNYLLAISFAPNQPVAEASTPVGLAWTDVSVGEFHVQHTTLGDVMGDIARISPAEVILSGDLEKAGIEGLAQWWDSLSGLNQYFVRYHNSQYRDLKLAFTQDQQRLRKHLESFSVRESAAMNLALSYVNVNLPEIALELDMPHQYYSSKYLQMDPRTRDALELTHRSIGSKHSVVGSLLNVIKETVTVSGSRMLNQWLNSPVTDVNEITQRQDHVQAWLDNPSLHRRVRAQLVGIGDVMRLVQKLVVRPNDVAPNLISIADALVQLNEVQKLVASSESKAHRKLAAAMTVPIDLAEEILNTLHVEAVAEPSDIEEEESHLEDTSSGSYSNAIFEKYRRVDEAPKFEFSVRADFDDELIALHGRLDELKRQGDKYLEDMTETLTSIDPKVSITKRDVSGRHSNVIYIATKVKHLSLIEDMFESGEIREKRKTSLLIKPPKWAELQKLVDETTEAIVIKEQKILNELRLSVSKNVAIIREVARLADYIDVTASFAVSAHHHNLIRPKFTKATKLYIEDGRHLVVESALSQVGRLFHANTTKMGKADGLTWVVSGPNMGGKSTFLRQNALAVILAQIGCYVPASKASMSVVDRIFTRIGASDDLFSNLSTFMVEMVETASILTNATPNSLAVVDEIGRGTSGKEGLSIAYATLVYLLTQSKCRTLFATHFGPELKELLDGFNVNQNNLRWLKTRKIDHQLESGISPHSGALEVAKQAGFPKKALDIAEDALSKLALKRGSIG
ncbi:hypothetical protein DIURU_000792 [Diutina rugosa]|uniref:DNA mismatch repair proteins mutS family domain-containing protein n=1 Tax=Diutina rugosa TaxID=5481 RepID=A0A642UWT5_DIURU|nr:uncharacterized protein DIURU_000792 [Diutina rugosa]KAA8907108.1 hypothetical protein DIURU_000792 [Diutina rugosa]